MHVPENAVLQTIAEREDAIRELTERDHYECSKFKSAQEALNARRFRRKLALHRDPRKARPRSFMRL